METEAITHAFQQFVDNNNDDSNNRNQLLVLNGDWGVGKTYLWENIIKECIENDSKNKNYIYVSLFGVTSIDDIKKQIIINKGKIAQSGYSLKTFLDSATANFDSFPIVGKNMKLANLSGLLIDFIFNRVTQNTTLCIDDIERRGKGADLKDLLGMFLHLKEKNKCKIIFILNQNQLSDDDREIFNKYYEKVIDFTLELSPNTEYSVGCVIPEDYTHYERILFYCKLLKINNIRIIKKIYRNLMKIFKDISVDDNDVNDTIINKMVLLLASIHSKSKYIPSIDFLRNYSPMVFSVLEYIDDSKTSKEENVNWGYTLLQYGYNGWDKYDEYFKNYIETGWLDPSFYDHVVNDELLKIKEFSQGFYRENIIPLYKNSFNNNEDDFIEALLSYYNNHYININISILDGITTILRSLDKNNDADQIVNHFFANNDNILTEIHYIHQMNEFHGHQIDPLIMKKIDELQFNEKKSMDLKTIIHKLSYKESLEDFEYNIRIFRSASADDFYRLFKSENSEHLSVYISQNRNHPNIIEALKRIAKESRFNKVRIETLYGITVEE